MLETGFWGFGGGTHGVDFSSSGELGRKASSGAGEGIVSRTRKATAATELTKAPR